MKRNSKVLLILALVAVGMFIFGYANVPLFKAFCSSLGINLSPNAEIGEEDEEIEVDQSRPLKVLFTTTVNDDLPIMFESKKDKAEIFVGQQDKNIYHFVNLSDDTLYFRPVHSVFPAEASKRYTMIECFCFKDMTLMPKEDIEVPLVYYFKPSLSEKIGRVTMHYTLFKRTKDEVEKAREKLKDFEVDVPNEKERSASGN
ncbi:MAG: hypothetical protein GF404_02420 [candidate division Zixibacteria bacterium]|nr:hypothetical protein [candidate division Zixibacteria bacterium]